ncbi:Brix domain-containing protein-like protein [Microthyrium microscopicum]|uniref:Ribosome production factor 2 homolog n=1 Tax=Microthyrium microscopicum TaxID=703497 RepID=A0A6A6USE3_9PEZI|nr:Brix domain-containing protein-like protein [Microthyrium microscopicum]
MLTQKVVPRNARSKRALEKREPHIVENPKNTLILRGEKCSKIVQLALTDINTLKEPYTVKFSKKNNVRPFEDPSSLEFFSEKNDVALLLFGHHSKKRPHCLVAVRCFEHKILDMLELYIDPETFRTISQFKTQKPTVGLKPMLAFSGTLFDSPTPNAYTMAKNLFTDMFRANDVPSIDVEALQFMIHFVAAEEQDGQPPPAIQMRVYRIITKKSGHKLPRVEVEEIGPRIDFRIGRVKEADDSVMREALKKPKQLQPKTKKNVTTDDMGDKIGRIHVGKQDLSTMQTRKIKGLKRHLDVPDNDDEMDLDEASAKVPRLE